MEVAAGQVKLWGSLPHSENNVLQPMLHPGGIKSTINIMTICASCHDSLIDVPVRSATSFDLCHNADSGVTYIIDLH